MSALTKIKIVTVALTILFLNSCANTNWRVSTDAGTPDLPEKLPRVPAPAATPAPVKEWTCSYTAFGEVFIGKGNSQAEAKAKGLEACANKSNSMHCTLNECGSN